MQFTFRNANNLVIALQIEQVENKVSKYCLKILDKETHSKIILMQLVTNNLTLLYKKHFLEINLFLLLSKEAVLSRHLSGGFVCCISLRIQILLKKESAVCVSVCSIHDTVYTIITAA